LNFPAFRPKFLHVPQFSRISNLQKAYTFSVPSHRRPTYPTYIESNFQPAATFQVKAKLCGRVARYNGSNQQNFRHRVFLNEAQQTLNAKCTGEDEL